MMTIKWDFDHDDNNDQDPHEHHHDHDHHCYHLHLVINLRFEGFIVNHTGEHVKSLPEDEYDDIFDDIHIGDFKKKERSA